MNKEELIKEIEIAFKDVKLEDGVGIFEADEYDARANELVIQEARKKDKSWWNEWKYIEDKYIKYYSDVMCFMDSKGIRWVLPAYMIFAIKNFEEGYWSIDTTIYAIGRDALGYDKLDLLTLEQKKVIAKFLQYILSVGEDFIDSDFAKSALNKEWDKYLK
jgi:hypothetical protein